MPKNSWRLGVLILTVLMALGVSAAVNAVNAKPDLAVQLSPASQTVDQGKTVAFTVKVTSVNGLTGNVALAAAGFASGATATFSPASFTLSENSYATATMSVATTNTAKTGAAGFTVTATSGKVSSSIKGTLTVTAQASGSLGLASTPSTVTVAPGAVAAYSLTLTRDQVSQPVSLEVIGLPPGATWSFTQNPVSGAATSTTLQVTTSDTTNDGSYSLQLRAAGTGDGGSPVMASTAVTLIVKTTPKDFTLGVGELNGLAPGVTVPVNLVITNPNKKPISLSNLSVTIRAVDLAPNAPAGRPCAVADYAVDQFSGVYPVTVPAQSTRSLQQLGVESAKWPQLRMLSTSDNQDNCKGATLALAFSGSGQGN